MCPATPCRSPPRPWCRSPPSRSRHGAGEAGERRTATTEPAEKAGRPDRAGDGHPIVEPAPAPAEPAAGPVEPAPAPVQPAPAPAEREWTVEPNQSLWLIAQEAYGASDTATTVSLVGMLFDRNRDQLWDPNELEIGMTLELPVRPA